MLAIALAAGADSEDIFIKLSAEIKHLQNTYGEVPAIDKKTNDKH